MKHMKTIMLICAAGAVCALWGGGTAAAQEAVMMGKNPSECEVAAGLGVSKPGCPAIAHPGSAAKKPGTRGLAIGNIDQMPSPPPAPAQAQAPAVRQQHTAAFQINFEFASARLTPDAQLVLDKIGAVMSAPDAGSVKFRIAGHTDGVGSGQRNLKLSKDRAEAVKEYLTSHYGIPDTRLQALGKGAKELRNKADPSAAENRRVEITNLGS